MAIYREQKLIDIMFEIGLTIASHEFFANHKSNETVAKWISEQLKKCGFETEPTGSSWGVLKN